MSKKYTLTGNKIIIPGYTLYRIRALISFDNVTVGESGGYIESENNLSHDGDCWVSGDAYVCGNAKVFGNAKVIGDARIFDNAKVYGMARVFRRSHVYGNAQVYGKSWITDNAHVCGDAHIAGLVNIEVDRNNKIDHGIWIWDIKLDGKYYLISSTLEKVLME